MTTSSGMAASVVCPLSDRPMHPWLSVPVDWRRPQVPQRFELYWCRESQFGLVYPRPTIAEVSRFYEVSDYFTHSQASVASHQVSLAPSSLAARVKLHLAWRFDFGVPFTNAWWRALVGNTSVSLCELGCGNGANLLPLQQLNYELYGVEPDARARAAAQTDGLTILAGTAELIPPEIASRQFDIVLMNHSLEHCVDSLAALKNAAQLLKPGGCLVVETPNNHALGGRLSGIAWPWLDVPRHLNFFTPKSLAMACAKVGLQWERTEYQGYCRQFSHDWLQLERQAAQVFAATRLSDSLPRVATVRQKSWQLLAATLLAPAQWKYDSVRIVARKLG